jgi:hypothetical protein
MTDKLFDSFIKHKLDNFESEVPADMWNRITEKKKKRRAIFWWNMKAAYLFIGVAIVAISIAFLYKSKAAESIAKQSKSIEKETKSPLLMDEKKATFEPNVNVYSKHREKYTEDKELIESYNLSANKSSLKAKIKTENTNTDTYIIASTKENTYYKSEIEKNFLNNSRASKKNNLKEKLAKNQPSEINNNKKNFSKNVIDQNKITNVYTGFGLTNNDYKNFVENNINAGVETNSLNILKSNFTKEVAKLNLGNLFGSEDCPSARGSRRNDFYIEVYASPEFSFKKVISTEPGLDAYLTRKDSVEVLRGGFSVGARISKSISNNILLKAGLQYTQINEQFSLKTENERRQTIIINSHTAVRPGQSDTTISDTSVFVQIGYRVQTNMNFYRSFEMPLLVSYEMNNNNNSKWTCAINAGAILNLTSWYEGRTIDSKNNLVSINSKVGNTFYRKNTLGVGLYTGLSFMYKLNDNLRLFAEPYARLSLNKMQSVEGFNQRFNAVGVQLGARINLNKKNLY